MDRLWHIPKKDHKICGQLYIELFFIFIIVVAMYIDKPLDGLREQVTPILMLGKKIDNYRKC